MVLWPKFDREEVKERNGLMGTVRYCRRVRKNRLSRGPGVALRVAPPAKSWMKSASGGPGGSGLRPLGAPLGEMVGEDLTEIDQDE